MQQLTFKNALADTVNFANNVKLPFDTSNKSSPENAVRLLMCQTASRFRVWDETDSI